MNGWTSNITRNENETKHRQHVAEFQAAWQESRNKRLSPEWLLEKSAIQQEAFRRTRMRPVLVKNYIEQLKRQNC